MRDLLLAAAREARALSYSELLLALGHRFTRPKMRALCRTLDAIDAAGKAAGEPGLAVLVVRRIRPAAGTGMVDGRCQGQLRRPVDRPRRGGAGQARASEGICVLARMTAVQPDLIDQPASRIGP
ncbi:hypothetical protein AB5I41_04535 [Sphingomonas sp. MMS24-JH45]